MIVSVDEPCDYTQLNKYGTEAKICLSDAKLMCMSGEREKAMKQVFKALNYHIKYLFWLRFKLAYMYENVADLYWIAGKWLGDDYNYIVEVQGYLDRWVNGETIVPTEKLLNELVYYVEEVIEADEHCLNMYFPFTRHIEIRRARKAEKKRKKQISS